MHLRSRVSSTRESESASSSSPSAGASKSRMHTSTLQHRLKGQQRLWCGPFIAVVAVTIVLVYTIFMISQVLVVDPKQQNQNQQVDAVRQQLRNFHRQIEEKQQVQHERKETFQQQQALRAQKQLHPEVPVFPQAQQQQTAQDVEQQQKTQEQQQKAQEQQQKNHEQQQKAQEQQQKDQEQQQKAQEQQQKAQEQQRKTQEQQQKTQEQQQKTQEQQQQTQQLQKTQEQFKREDLGPNECQYDGHCPVRSTCAAAEGGGGAADNAAGERPKGVCVPFESRGRYRRNEDDNPVATESCIAACRTELEMDEHFYQESWPEEALYEAMPASAGRPRGCLYVYYREPEGDRYKALQAADDAVKWTEVPPSVRNWTEHRFRHVIRVDPVNEVNNDDAWMAYCYNACVADADCATTSAADVDASAPPPFTCQLGACQRNKEYWNPNNGGAKDANGEDVDNNPEMVIVTGASSAFIKGLTNLCASLRYWAPHHRVVVYNLGGMTPGQIHEIEGWSNVAAVEWRDGVPKHYPPHVSTGKVYAWKPIIVNETLHKYKSIFWLDAGSTVMGPITPISDVIQKTGMMLVKGQDLDMKTKSHNATYEWFNKTKDTFQAGPHFSGNTQAFMLPSRYVESIVIPDAICAMDPNCIVPKGAYLKNHRFDQTTISILAYMPKVRAPHYTEYLAATRRQVNPDMRKPSFKMIWTTRSSVDQYTKWDADMNSPQQKVLTSEIQ